MANQRADKSGTRGLLSRLAEGKCAAAFAVIFGGLVMEAQAVKIQFDFGGRPVAEGFRWLSAEDLYSSERGYGWLPGHALETGEIDAPDELRRTYLMSGAEARFRIDLPPGRYRFSALVGDRRVGPQALSLAVQNGRRHELPTVRPRIPRRQFTLIGDVDIEHHETELIFSTPESLWVVNGLRIEEIGEIEPPRVAEEQVWIPHWPDFASWPDPVAPHRETFLSRLQQAPAVESTGIREHDYLEVMEGIVRYFLQLQDGEGAIIDPFQNEELQYSTPAFALAAAAVAIYGDREDLLEPAALAMDHATYLLEQAAVHHQHEDFYPPMVAHAYRLLHERVKSERAATWRERICCYDPHRTYRFGQGGGNWNVVALSGEALYELFGLREGLSYAEEALERQTYRFTPWGMYLDVNSEAMAYDQFPRLWLADLLGSGYDGRLAKGLRVFLERGAWTSLFAQSPAGELPTGGRSAHHQWNEAAQCVTFEVFSRLAKAEGKPEVAGVFKRAARRSLESIQRWVRPTGELWIVKNRVDPKARHGYESYSFHSQYNLLSAAMLAIAYEHGLSTAGIDERPTPAERGGFVVELGEDFRKIFANASGTYVQIDTGGIPNYDPTGLVRIHFLNTNPQLGPSDGLVERVAGTTAAVGIAWRGSDGEWHRLAEHQKEQLASAAVKILAAAPEEVRFRITYEGDFEGAGAVHEDYRLTSGGVEIGWQVDDYDGPLRLIWPVLASDGERESQIHVKDQVLRVALDEATQFFEAPGAGNLRVHEEQHPFRNGWARLATAEFANGQPPLLRVSPGRAPAETQ